ncbi:MAG TPA: glycosyltransferase [Ktedonobacteraceae bacterium]|nr:glycosyltransferase [Ktedonobacteraceae bacterium]
MSQLVNATQRTILFLIADTGAGHRSAANAISNAIRLISQQEQQEWQARRSTARQASEGVEQATLQASEFPPPTYRIEIIDVFEEYSRFPLREAVKLYGPTIRYNPKLYGEFFHGTNREETVMTMNSLAAPLIFNGLLRLFTSVQPDIVVSVHPVINFVTVRALRELGLNIPFITVVTDLVSVHYAWFAPGVDAYIVPTEQAKERYLKRKLDPERVQVLGMPIDPKFTRPTESKETLQRRLRLEPDVPVVLLVGGGDGAGGLQAAVRAISHARLPVQLMVVTGRNRRLYANLQRSRSKLHVPAQIFGFVQNMPELMHASDVIVTKAGPGTICEALACGLPVVLSGYIPGQEEGNVDFVVEHEAGVLALDPAALIDTLRRLIKPGSPELRLYRESAARISKPRASFDIAQYLLSKIPQTESAWQSAQWQIRQRHMSGRLQSAIRLRSPRNPLLPKTLLKSPVVRRLSLLNGQTRDLSSKEDVTHHRDQNR